MNGEVANLFVRVGADVNGAMAGLGRLDSRFRRFSSNASRMARIGGLGVAAGVAVALNAAGGFEQALNTFQAVSDATGQQMRKVGELAKALGADVSLPATSAKDAADAMTELAKGGLSVKNSMKAARGVLQLSAAAQIDNAEAAKIAARALNAFHLKGRDATRVADLLAAASNASTAEITDLAMGMQMASAVFVQGNQDIEGLTTSLGLMANAGIVGSDAGTSLKTMMLRLMAPTGEASSAIKDLGVKLRDSRGKMLPMRELVGQFTTKLAGMSAKQRDAALATIFGQDAIRAANVVLGGGVKAWDKMNGAVRRSGAAQELAAAKMKGFKGALEGLKSVAETFAITIGEKIIGAATRGIRKLQDLVGWMDTVASAKGARLKFKLVVEGLQSVLTKVREFLFGSLTSKPIKLPSGKILDIEVEENQGLAQRFAAALSSAFDAISWTETGRKVIAGITSALSATGNLAAALGAVVTSAAAQVNWEEVGMQVGPGILTAVFSAFVAAGDPGFWARNWRLMLGVALAALGIVFTPAKFLKAIPLVGGLLLAVKAAAGPFVRALVRLAGEAIKRFGQGFAPGVTAAVGKLAPKVLAALRGLPGAIGRIAMMMAGKFGLGMGMLARDAVSLAIGLVKRVASALRGLVWQAESAAKDAAGAIRRKAASWFSAAVLLAKRVIDGVKSGLASLGGAVRDKLGDVVSAIQAAAGDAYAWAVNIGSQIINGVLGGLGGLYGAVRSKVESALSSALSNLNPFSPVEHGGQKYIGEPLVFGALKGIAQMAPKLTKELSRALNSAVDRAQKIVTSRQGAFRAAFDRLASDALRAFDAKRDALRGALSVMVSAGGSSFKFSSGGKTPTELLLEREDAAQASLDRSRSRADAQEKLRQARAIGDPDAIRAALRELEDVEMAERRAALERKAELEREAAEKALAEKEKQFDAETEVERAKLERRLQRILAKLASGKIGKKKAKRLIAQLFENFGISPGQAGIDIGKAFGPEFTEAFNLMLRAVRRLHAALEKLKRLENQQRHRHRHRAASGRTSVDAYGPSGIDVVPARASYPVEIRIPVMVDGVLLTEVVHKGLLKKQRSGSLGFQAA